MNGLSLVKPRLLSSFPDWQPQRLRSVTRSRCVGRLCRSFQDLKLIAVAATGVDNVDLEFCRSKGIKVCNTRGYAVGSLPEHALMLMLALRRNLVGYRDDVRDGQWHEASQFCLLGRPIGDLKGATIGISWLWHAWASQWASRARYPEWMC